MPERAPRLRVDAETSRRMGRVRQQDTAGELRVRKVLSGLGTRYRVRNRDLPGSPDIANRSRWWAIFVHGCYWHHHKGCPRATVPKRNRDWWLAKFARNAERDARNVEALRDLRFEVLVVWECETQDLKELTARLGNWLRDQGDPDRGDD